MDRNAVEYALRQMLSFLDYDLFKEVDREDDDAELEETFAGLAANFIEDYASYPGED